MEHGFSLPAATLSAIITILIATLFIHFAAKFVLDRSSLISALLTAVVATFLAELVAAIAAGAFENRLIPTLAGIAVWSLVAAIFYRARWVQGAIIGLVAWILWAIVHWLMNRFF